MMTNSCVELMRFPIPHTVSQSLSKQVSITIL